jgi:dihydrofolate reductase
MTVTLVAAVAANGVIGRDGGIPWHLPGEQAQFKRLTMGHVLVMGRLTYESIGRPLPGRTTIVVSRRQEWAVDGVLRAPDVASALAQAAEIDEEVFVVGGAAVYEAALGRADRMVLTHVDAAPDGDTRFPDVDWTKWREQSQVQHDGFMIATYVRADME